MNSHLRIGSATGDFYSGRFAQQPFEPFDGERLIVHQVHAQRYAHTCRGSTTRTPAYLPLWTACNDALSPNRRANREARLSRPCPGGIAAMSKPGPVSLTSNSTRPSSVAART